MNHMRDGQVNINFQHLNKVRDVSGPTPGLLNTDLP
jgi:hypothetical protein